MTTRVAVVERRSLGRVATVFSGEGFVVTPVGGTDLAGLEAEVVILEVERITGDVLGDCSRITAASSAPVVIVCEQSGEAEVVDGYGVGAAIVLTEPIGSHELTARIRALIRRCRPGTVPTSDGVLRIGGVELDPGCRRVTVQGIPLALPRKEFDIAEILMRSAGNLVTRRELLDLLWGTDTSDSKSLDVQVGRLRARLGEAEGLRRIVTVRGVGYRLLTDDDLARAVSVAPPSRT